MAWANRVPSAPAARCLQAFGNIVAQFAGAIMGSLLLWGTTSMRDGGLGANSVSPHFSNGNAILGEAVMTFL